jgi:hypothetical protein
VPESVSTVAVGSIAPSVITGGAVTPYAETAKAASAKAITAERAKPFVECPESINTPFEPILLESGEQARTLSADKCLVKTQSFALTQSFASD